MSKSSDIEISAVDLLAQERMLSDPDRMNKIFKHLSAGGTITDYCKLVGQPYAELVAWMKADADRWEMYEQGKRARQDWLFERVLQEYKSISTLDIRRLYNSEGGLLPVNEWPDDVAPAIAGVETFEVYEQVDGERVPVGETKKIKTIDKAKTLEALGKYLRMFADVIEVRGEISIRGALDEAEARLSAAREVGEAVVEVETKAEKDEPI